MFSLRPVFKSSLALLILFVLPSASVVVAQQQDVENATPPLTSDDNTTALLLTNYNALREEGQGFYLEEKYFLYEKPDSVTPSFVGLYWWCDLDFSSDTNNYGYVGRSVGYSFGSSLDTFIAQGAQIPNGNRWPASFSVVVVPTLGIFEGQFHFTHDDSVIRYWDDGSLTHPLLGWEGHDEGATSQNTETSAWSMGGTMTKITTKAAAELLGMEVGEMTTETCSKEYEAAWNFTHVPDPIDTSLTKLEETVAQLQADNKELLSRINTIEGSLTANGSGSSSDDGKATATSSSSPFMAALEHATTDIVMQAFLTVAVSIGLVLFW